VGLEARPVDAAVGREGNEDRGHARYPSPRSQRR
jgi:hypothetical protein